MSRLTRIQKNGNGQYHLVSTAFLSPEPGNWLPTILLALPTLAACLPSGLSARHAFANQ
jgi:hypothetical protein